MPSTALVMEIVPLLTETEVFDFMPSSAEEMVISPLLIVMAPSPFIAFDSAYSALLPLPDMVILDPVVVIFTTGELLPSPNVTVPSDERPLLPDPELEVVTVPPVMLKLPSVVMQVEL